MARVIKGGQGEKRSAPRANPTRLAAGRKVIDRDLYRAQQDAAEIIAAAEAERDAIIAEGKRKAAKAREEASTLAAEEAFAQAAQEALLAFRRRAERYQEAADDIRTLSYEVARRIVGAELSLSLDDIDALVHEGMKKLRARRKLRVQIPQRRYDALVKERPILMRALEAEPDLLVEANDDVSEGFARVALEVGDALCAEQDALDSLAEAINVDETAVAPEPQSAMHSGLLDRERLGLDQLHVDDEPRIGVGAPEGESTDRRSSFAYSDASANDREQTDVLARARERRRKDNGFLAEASATGVLDDSATGEAPASDEGESAEAQNRGYQRAPAPEEDVERTMALDVSDLREDLRADERRQKRGRIGAGNRVDPEGDDGDDLDLFADPSVPSLRRPD